MPIKLPLFVQQLHNFSDEFWPLKEAASTLSHTFLTATSFDFNISFVFELSSLENKQTSTLSECKECGKELEPTRRQI